MLSPTFWRAAPMASCGFTQAMVPALSCRGSRWGRAGVRLMRSSPQGDFDGDGHPDLVARTSDGGVVAVSDGWSRAVPGPPANRNGGGKGSRRCSHRVIFPVTAKRTLWPGLPMEACGSTQVMALEVSSRGVRSARVGTSSIQ